MSAGSVLSVDDLAELVLGPLHGRAQPVSLRRGARTLSRYAGEAERAWQRGERDGVDNWLQSMELREAAWVGVIDRNLQSLSSEPLDEQEVQHLTFLRGLDWPIHKKGRPWLRVPFPQNPSAGSLVIELPERFLPGKYRVFWRVITNGVIPGLFTLLLCVGLYRLLVVPLNNLRKQANAWRADQLNVRLSSGITQRPDELGELARPSIQCPNACNPPSPCNSNCCATCPMNCARR